MKTAHRNPRSRQKAQPASIGAPFRGAFRAEFDVFAPGGGIFFMEAKAMAENGSDTAIEMFTPNKVIDPEAFYIRADTGRVPVLSAVVDGDGTKINGTFSDAAAATHIEAIAGHPALTGANGMICGGAYAIG